MSRRLIRGTRFAAAVVLLAGAVVLVLLAADVLGGRDAVRDGDRHFASEPPSAAWHASTRLPFDPARALLGLDGELRFRAAAQQFAAVQAAGRGYDNGLSESRDRGELEAELTELARSGDLRRGSEAANLLGILAFADSRPSGPTRRPSTRASPTSRRRSGSTPATRTPSSTSSCCCVSWSRRAPDAAPTTRRPARRRGTAARAAEFPGGGTECRPRSSS